MDSAGSLHSDVLRFLSDQGYIVDTYLGCGGYRLEFAVRHPDKPGSYLLGVECDGDAYINAATVRDRECLRYSVLTQLGWSLHRVWSIEWLLNRSREEQRLLMALEAAKTRPQPEPQIAVFTQPDAKVSSSEPTTFSSFSSVPSADPSQSDDEDSYKKTLASVQKLGKPYVLAPLPIVSSNFQEFYQSSSDSAIKKLMIELLTIEAPMTFDAAARRVSQCWSGKAFTNRASERVQALVRQLTQLKQLYVDERGTLWRSQRQADEWSGFRLPPEDGRKLDQIPVLEVEEAMLVIANAALSIDSEMLMREAYAALTPYKKLTQPVRDTFELIIDGLLLNQKLREADGRIFPS
jgi:hypothetical protein